MPATRFRCPHCHASVDAARLEHARAPVGELRVCPECDEPVLVEAKHGTAGATAAPSPEPVHTPA